MSERKIINLYEHFKNTPKKLKIICDWDEVIQACEPYALWRVIRHTKHFWGGMGDRQYVKFIEFFTDFWSKKYIRGSQTCPISYSPYGSRLISLTEVKEENAKGKGIASVDPKVLLNQQAIKNSSDFYQQAPFLTIAEDLLKLIKEDKVEELTFLTANDDKVFPMGDNRKKAIWNETFGKLGNYLGSLQIKLVPFNNENETKNKTKTDWIKQNASDFDVFIDDDPENCKSVIENNDFFLVKPCKGCMAKYMGECHGETDYSCSNCSKMNFSVFTPYYPALKEKHDERVIFVKQEVSNLTKEIFQTYGTTS